MEEDDEDYKLEILPWALTRDWRRKVAEFLHQRDRLWARIGYRAVVSNRCCEEVITTVLLTVLCCVMCTVAGSKTFRSRLTADSEVRSCWILL